MNKKKNGKIVIILGDNEVGKTTILYQFAKQKFLTNYVSTIGVDFYTKTLIIGENTINFYLWDTNGEEIEQKYLPLNIYQKANSFLIVCSYDSLESCRNVPNYLDFIRTFINNNNNNIDNENIPIYVIINKNDIKDKFFQKETICSFFKDDLSYINIVEVSARNNNEINNLFIQISKKLLGISFIENDDIFNLQNTTNNSILNANQEVKIRKCNKCC